VREILEAITGFPHLDQGAGCPAVYNNIGRIEEAT
jgi:hypothetical protein